MIMDFEKLISLARQMYKTVMEENPPPFPVSENQFIIGFICGAKTIEVMKPALIVMEFASDDTEYL